VFEFSRVKWGRFEIQIGSKSVLRASVLLVLMGLITCGSVMLVVLAANRLDESGTFPPEIVLPLIVIVGVVALLATLAIAAATFGLFEIADKSQALGLPAGSVQAVIALSLILIFAVVALYASSSTTSKELTSTGLTAAEVKGIPADQIVSKQVEKGGKAPTYEVVRSIEDENLKDINTQLLTTVSTLVIAVAGFYFGSKSVQEGNQAAIAAAGPSRRLTVIEPRSPHARYPKKPPLVVKVQTVPPGAPIRWKLWDDDEGQLARHPDGTFTYIEGENKKEGSATLYFEQVDDPGVSDSLVVNFSAGPDPSAKPGTPRKPRPSRKRKQTKKSKAAKA
jgi:hypothetical protein